jgi:tetratricopeptide (TPR) repeat protein
MKAISKLKDEARRHEQRGDWDQAINAYLDVLTAADEAGGGEAELPLFNRVGDLYVRVGRQHDAVHYYEQAADGYAEAGLYNNAIALCNKALRYVPGRLGVLRRLSEYSASQGFLTDARAATVQYAERAFAEGQADAALAALGEYANASGDPEIRELLGRRLYEQGKVQEGLAELKRAYAMRLGAGDVGAAATMRREILSLEPTAFDDEQEGGTVPLPPQAHAFPPRAPDLPDLPDEPRVTAEPPVQSVAASFAADIGAGIDELEPEGHPLLVIETTCWIRYGGGRRVRAVGLEVGASSRAAFRRSRSRVV